MMKDACDLEIEAETEIDTRLELEDETRVSGWPDGSPFDVEMQETSASTKHTH